MNNTTMLAKKQEEAAPAFRNPGGFGRKTLKAPRPKEALSRLEAGGFWVDSGRPVV